MPDFKRLFEKLFWSREKDTERPKIRQKVEVSESAPFFARKDWLERVCIRPIEGGEILLFNKSAEGTSGSAETYLAEAINEKYGGSVTIEIAIPKHFAYPDVPAQNVEIVLDSNTNNELFATAALNNQLDQFFRDNIHSANELSFSVKVISRGKSKEGKTLH